MGTNAFSPFGAYSEVPKWKRNSENPYKRVANSAIDKHGVNSRCLKVMKGWGSKAGRTTSHTWFDRKAVNGGRLFILKISKSDRATNAKIEKKTFAIIPFKNIKMYIHQLSKMV